MEKDLEGPDERFDGEDPPEIDVYLFVWDRYRMIAKDFILQLESNDATIYDQHRPKMHFLLRSTPGSGVEERLWRDRICVEVHERMCRWHIMMEHHMAHNGKFFRMKDRLDYNM